MARKEVGRSVFESDRAYARQIRALCEERGHVMINMIGGPGSGKTTLLKALIPLLSRPAAVVTGDVEGDYDGEILREAGIRAAQVKTHGACHLTAELILPYIQNIDLPQGGVLFVENVGNLVCPATFPLGEHHKMAVLSAAEGHEKPIKYPALFRNASVCALTKIELAPLCRFDADQASKAVLSLNPDARIFPLSALAHQGLEALAACIDRL